MHWERAAEVFEEWLVDHETACNVGSWIWLSCTAFFSMSYRVYSPIAFWEEDGRRRCVCEVFCAGVGEV